MTIFIAQEKANSFIQNRNSPFEFMDEVDINEIIFINNYKYACYNISNPTNWNIYYSVIDIQTNKVVFNTDKEILSFISYSIRFMLAFTSDDVYEVSIIKKIILVLIHMVVHILIIICVLNGNQYGLCSNFDPDKTYKLNNTSKCFSYDEISDVPEIYYTLLNLLKSKSGYKLEEETGVIDCGSKCSSPTTIIIPPKTIIIPKTTLINNISIKLTTIPEIILNVIRKVIL